MAYISVYFNVYSLRSTPAAAVTTSKAKAANSLKDFSKNLPEQVSH